MTYHDEPEGCTWIPKQPKPVEDCCFQHDIDYINRTGKLAADMRFFRCLWKKGYYLRAILFTSAVLTFGYFFYYNREIKALWKKILKSEK